MKRDRTMILAMLLTAVTVLSPLAAVSVRAEEDKISYNDFLEMTDEGIVESIDWSEDEEEISFTDTDGNEYRTDNPKYEEFKKDMLEKGIDVSEGGWFERHSQVFMLLIQLVIYSSLLGVILHSSGVGQTWRRDKKPPKSSVKFSDVAGLEEVKEDLITVVDFLKSPQKYKDAGAEIPNGILLYGPPGTGKTLLARAVAGEAGVNFISTSGSDFDEKYVGVGASRMRKMFEEAKKNAPCIIFVDEIDSLGGKRKTGQSNSDRQTLNSFLAEMDGFDGSSGVVVMAATNRIEDLDPALTRPGRFDNHFAVSLPETPSERRKVIQLYSDNKKFAEDVDFDVFARETTGSSPAMVKTILNEAAIMAVRQNNGIINRQILDEAWMKQLMEGHLKKSGEKDNLEIVAWHESGHALAGLLTGHDLNKVSIIPSTSGTGGATFITPKKLGLQTKAELEARVIVLYAGRCAELLLTEDEDQITTGASNDIEKATEIVREMIFEYGMDDDSGLLNLDVLEVKPESVMNRAMAISDNLRARAYQLLEKNYDILRKIAEELKLKETLTGEEVREIVEEGKTKKE